MNFLCLLSHLYFIIILLKIVDFLYMIMYTLNKFAGAVSYQFRIDILTADNGD